MLLLVLVSLGALPPNFFLVLLAYLVLTAGVITGAAASFLA